MWCFKENLRLRLREVRLEGGEGEERKGGDKKYGKEDDE